MLTRKKREIVCRWRPAKPPLWFWVDNIKENDLEPYYIYIYSDGREELIVGAPFADVVVR